MQAQITQIFEPDAPKSLENPKLSSAFFQELLHICSPPLLYVKYSKDYKKEISCIVNIYKFGISSGLSSPSLKDWLN